MSNADVLVIVDVVGALARTLQDNVYLVDNHKYMGSWKEGQCELYTACKDGENIKWRVVAISPDNDVEIVNFTGQIINEKVCVPQKEGTDDDVYWEGKVETRGSTGDYQYSMTLSMDGKQLSFDPFLRVQ